MRFIAVALLLAPMTLAAQGGLSLESFLVVGKASGACGILDQQLQFQSTTRMDGGEAFVFRFWNTESARLGMTLEQYSKHCDTSLDTYARLQRMAQTIDASK